MKFVLFTLLLILPYKLAFAKPLNEEVKTFSLLNMSSWPIVVVQNKVYQDVNLRPRMKTPNILIPYYDEFNNLLVFPLNFDNDAVIDSMTLIISNTKKIPKNQRPFMPKPYPVHKRNLPGKCTVYIFKSNALSFAQCEGHLSATVQNLNGELQLSFYVASSKAL